MFFPEITVIGCRPQSYRLGSYRSRLLPNKYQWKTLWILVGSFT
jgi:hypothetical protein